MQYGSSPKKVIGLGTRSDGRTPVSTINVNGVVYKEFNRGQLKKVYRNNEKTGVLAFCQEPSQQHKLAEEVELLERIKSKGIKVPKANLVEIEGIKAIQMDYLDGVFIDIFKQDPNTILKELIILLIPNVQIDEHIYEKRNTEMGKVNYSLAIQAELNKKKAEEKKINVEAKEKLILDLENIYNKKEEIAINDLQFMIRPTGEVTVIDPQMANPLDWYKTDGAKGEFEKVSQIYENLAQLISALKHIPEEFNVGKLFNQGSQRRPPSPPGSWPGKNAPPSRSSPPSTFGKYDT